MCETPFRNTRQDLNPRSNKLYIIIFNGDYFKKETIICGRIHSKFMLYMLDATGITLVLRNVTALTQFTSPWPRLYPLKLA